MSGIGQVSVELGVEIHREIQEERGAMIADYCREVQVKAKLGDSDDVALEVSGRIDGLWTEAGSVVIEEIKSTLNARKLMAGIQNDLEHSYLLQVKMYGWMYWREHGIIPELRLLIVAAGSRETRVLAVDFDPVAFEVWVVTRQQYLREVWLDVQKFKRQRKDMSKALKFPFTKKRRGQIELMADVAAACRNQEQFMTQAPTGMGKTAGVMFPMMKSALRRGDKVFYVTPKNSQLREAEKFMTALRSDESAPLGLIMTSKPKICMQAEVVCSPEVCRFAKGHFDKVNQHDLISKLRLEPLINGELLRQYASEYEVCPYELSRQIMPWVDLVAGDYHYALSPRAGLRESARLPLVQEPKPLLAIDEAHNLAERAIDWYTLQVGFIAEDIVQAASKKLKKSLVRLNSWLNEALSKGTLRPCVVKLERESLVELVERWSHEMPEVLEEAGLEPGSQSLKQSLKQSLIACWFDWLAAAELCQLPEELFFATADVASKTLTIHCANAGPLMKEVLSKFHAVVAFSATMKPFRYHIAMDGFDMDRVVTKEYQSPFPSANRRIIAIPQVSTAFRDRPKNLPRIAEVIDRVIAIKKGNYIAFFPSFELMRQALPLVKAEGFEVIEQPPSASQNWVNETLRRLKRRRRILLMAVQGGVLSEGVDLPGDQLIGAFVIGPALSMVTPEREERRKRLAAGGVDGFANAYIFPAMARSIQSAGRVIRSTQDRGIIVLMDPRFLSGPYLEALPADWLGENRTTENLISQSILADVRNFWGEDA
jgi:DNA excision repair protein ERCC-2